MRSIFTCCLTAGVLVLAALASAVAVAPAWGQDPFVGRIALAIDPQTAKEVGLADTDVAKLKDFIDGRLKEAQTLVNSTKSAPPAERDAKMAEFLAESEKQGLELLTDDQRNKLNKIRIAKAGMVGVLDAEVAEKLNLNQQQKDDIAKAIGEFKQATATGTEDRKRIARAVFGGRIAGMLTDEQKKTWEGLSGVPAVAAAAAQPGSSAAAGSANGSRPAGSSVERAPGGPAELTVLPDGKMKVKFQYTPWKDVIEFFAKQAGYALVSDGTVPGTFNYPSDTRSYTPEQVLDLLNRVLLTQKGFLLVKADRMLMLFDVSQGSIPPEFVPIITPDELASKGEFELVRVQFQISKFTPDEVAADVKPMLGPYGTITALPKAHQLIVTELAGKLRAIKRTVDSVESDNHLADHRLVVIRLKRLMPSEFMTYARTQLGIPENQYFTVDGSLRITPDELGQKIVVGGKPIMVEKTEELVKLLESEPEPSTTGPELPPLELPQFVPYTITRADPTLVLQVLTTLLAGTPDARMSLDPKSGNLAILARPAIHATVRAIIDEMEGKGPLVEVFKLRKLDPQAAVLGINKLFGAYDRSDGQNWNDHVHQRPARRCRPGQHADHGRRHVFADGADQVVAGEDGRAAGSDRRGRRRRDNAAGGAFELSRVANRRPVGRRRARAGHSRFQL